MTVYSLIQQKETNSIPLIAFSSKFTIFFLFKVSVAIALHELIQGNIFNLFPFHTNKASQDPAISRNFAIVCIVQGGSNEKGSPCLSEQ